MMLSSLQGVLRQLQGPHELFLVGGNLNPSGELVLTCPPQTLASHTIGALGALLRR